MVSVQNRPFITDHGRP